MCKSKGDLRKDRRQDNRKHPLEPGSAMASVCTSRITHPGALATLSVCVDLQSRGSDCGPWGIQEDRWQRMDGVLEVPAVYTHLGERLSFKYL